MTGDINWAQLLELVTRLDAGAFDQVAVQFGDVSVRMSRTGSIPEAAAVALPNVATPSASEQPATSRATSSAAGLDAASDDLRITSPMIGVFYRHPSPGAPPFVEVGQSLSPDTVIGIVEIMKLMNPVPAGVAGVLREFVVDDGQGVEFGQTLALLDAGPS